MGNRVGDFVAGIEATFGRFSRSTEELAGFLKSAERFYLDYSGIARHYEENEENDIPFWRYLIYYSTLALDHAAADGGDASSDEDEDGEYNQAARELASCWPLLSVLVSSQYASVKSAAPAQTLPSPKKHGSREDMDMPPFPATSGSTLKFMSPPKVDKAIQTDDNGDDILSHPRPDMHRHPSIMRAVEPVTPPILYAEEKLSVDPDDILIHSSPSPSTTLWGSYLHRHNAESGRSLSDSTHLTSSSSNTASTLPSDILATPPQQGNMPLFAVNMDQPYPASTAMGRNFSSPGSVTPKPIRPGHARNNSSTPTLQDYQSDHHHHHFHPHHHHGADTKVLLSDRGDSTARIVSKQGDPNHYELDVEIGGHSVIFDPERPEQIEYRGPKLPNYSQSSFSSPSAMRSHELPTKVLLADRGDNTARLVPTPDGSYVLDVSIGGKKLLVNPERPAEIQYHNQQGEVVTQSLIHAQ